MVVPTSNSRGFYRQSRLSIFRLFFCFLAGDVRIANAYPTTATRVLVPEELFFISVIDLAAAVPPRFTVSRSRLFFESEGTRHRGG